MAITTGVRRFSMRSSKGFRLSRQMIFPEVRSPNSLISAPATKVRPAPMKTTALMVSSLSICATAAAMPAETAELSAFTGGLLMVTTAMPSTFASCTRSLMNSLSIAPCVRISGEWDAGFLRDDAELFNHRHDQRHALFAAQFLGIALGIAGDKRTVGSRCRFRGTECADEVVHLALELVGFDETVNAHRAEKMPDSLPHTARGNLLAKSKRRSKRAPVSATY